MRLTRVVALSLLVVALCAATAFAADPPKTLICEIKTVTKQGDGAVRTLYVKGDNWRGEMTVQGVLLRTIKNSKGLYTLHPRDRFAIQYPTGSSRDLPQSFMPCPINDFDAFLKRVEAKKGESTTMGGKTCDVYTYEDPQSKTACKFWLQTDKQVPVQIEMVGTEDKKATIIYTTYEAGAEVADAKFQLPKNIPIRMRRAPEILKDKKPADATTGAKEADPAKGADPAKSSVPAPAKEATPAAK